MLVLVALLVFVHTVAGETSCSDAGILSKETVLDGGVMDVIYACRDSKTVFILTDQRTLWRSEDEGRHWSQQMDKLEGSNEQQDFFGTGVAKIVVSNADRNRIFVQGVGKYHWVTSDCGKTYTKVASDKVLTDVLLHPASADLILASAFSEKCYGSTEEGFCNRQLWLSRDFGKSFHKKVDFVQGYQWGKGPEAVIYGTFPKGDNHQPLLNVRDAALMYTRNLWKTSHSALDAVVGFKVLEGELYAATQDKEGLLGLHRSRDDGVTMTALHFPSALRHQRYVIVSDGAGGALVCVVYEGDWGTLYASNGDTANMVTILRDVQMGAGAHLDLVSAESGSLLFANVVEKGREGEGSNSKRTVVSYDRGANWNAIPAPVNLPCKAEKGCSLHLHTAHKPILSQHREGDSQEGIIVSKQNVAGLVMATGNVGVALESNPDTAYTLLSRDGGGQFERALSGMHAIDMGGHGAVTVAAKNYRHTTHLHYNLDETAKFKSCAFANYEVDVSDIVTEPNGTSIKFFLYGKKKEGGDNVVISFDFRQLLPVTCRGLDAVGEDNSDYEYFALADGTDKQCLNGQHTLYSRRKSGVACVYPGDYQRRADLKSCKCTEMDYECNYCYEREGETRKIAQPDAPLPKAGEVSKCVWACAGKEPKPLPPANCDGTYTAQTEYRKIAGNKCHGGLHLDRRTLPCSGGDGGGGDAAPTKTDDAPTKVDSSTNKNAQPAEVKTEKDSNPTAPSGIVADPVSENQDTADNGSPSSSSSSAGVAVGVLLVIAVLGVVAFFVYTNKSSLDRGWSLNMLGQSQYAYAHLSQRLDPDDLLDDDLDEDEPSSLENAALASIGRTRGGLDCRVVG